MTAISDLVAGGLDPVERLAADVRQRHARVGPKLDCDGLDAAVGDGGGLVYCGDCGLVLARGFGDE